MCQPSFLSATTPSSSNETGDSNMFLIGLLIALSGGLFYTIQTLLLKKINNENIDYLTISIYSSYFGLPICAFLVLANDFGMKLNASTQPTTTTINPEDFTNQIIYMLVGSGVFMNLNLLFYILALKYEDASKITILSATDLIFAFLFQYEFLGVVSPWMPIFGAVLIMFGSVFIAAYKIFDRNQQPTSCLGKFLCFKF